MSLRGWLPRWLGLTLLVVVLCGAAGALGVPWMVDRGLLSAMKRTPYRLVYAGRSLTWPPGVLLREVQVAEQASGRIVATLHSLALGLAFGPGPTQPRVLVTLVAPSASLKADGAPAWPEDNARRFIKNTLKNFRFVGLRWTIERVTLEGRAGQRLTLRSVTGTARAQGPDTFQMVIKAAVTSTEGLGAEVQGPFTSSLTIRRYLDNNILKLHWEGKALRVVDGEREVKKVGAPWQVRITFPWLPTLSLGANPSQTVMTPANPRLQALWERL